MQPQKIALVSKLKVENLLALKKNHEDTREPTSSSKSNLGMPLIRSFHLMENADNILVSTQRKTCFHPVFPSPPTIPLHIQPQNILCPFLSKSQNPSSLYRALWGKCETLFLSWEELGTSWAQRWCEGRTRSCSWLPGFGWLLGLGWEKATGPSNATTKCM